MNLYEFNFLASAYIYALNSYGQLNKYIVHCLTLLNIRQVVETKRKHAF